MSVARSILSNTMFQFIGKLITAILGVISIKVIAAFLGKTLAGQYAYIYEFLAFFGILADLGLYTIAVQEMSKKEEDMHFIIGNVLGMRSILVTLMMSLAVIAAFIYPRFDETFIPLGVAIASISTILTILHGTISSVLQVKMKMQYFTVSIVLGKLVTLSYMLFVALYAFKGNINEGFYHLLLAGVIGNAVMLFTGWLFTARFVKLGYRFDITFWKQIIVKALPYGIALFLNTIYFRIDNLLMYFLLPQEVTHIGKGGVEQLTCYAQMCSGAEIGTYWIAMRMTEMLLIVPIYFMNSVLPVLTKYLKEGSQKLASLIRYSFEFLLTLAVPIVIGGYLLAFPLVFIVSTPDFLSSNGVYGSDIALKLLLFALFFAFLNVMFGILLVAINKQTKLLYINAICVVFNILANIAVIPSYGFRGAAFTSILCEAFILCATWYVARKHIPINLNVGRIVKIVFSGFVMGAVVFLLDAPLYGIMENFHVFPLIVIGGCVYGLMLFATGSVNKQMLQLLRK